MSFLDKFLNVMRLNPDDDDVFYNEDYDYDDEEEEVKPKSSFKKREKEDTFTDDYKEKPVKTTPKVTPIRPSKKQQNLAGMEVCVIKPTSVEDAREIAESFGGGGHPKAAGFSVSKKDYNKEKLISEIKNRLIKLLNER